MKHSAKIKLFEDKSQPLFGVDWSADGVNWSNDPAKMQLTALEPAQSPKMHPEDLEKLSQLMKENTQALLDAVEAGPEPHDIGLHQALAAFEAAGMKFVSIECDNTKIPGSLSALHVSLHMVAKAHDVKKVVNAINLLTQYHGKP